MLLVQKWPFFQIFFFGNIGHENLFCDILERKNASLGYKKKTSSKSHKVGIFPKGLTHAFGPKKAIFPSFLFRQYRLGKCLLRYSRRKRRLPRPNKRRSSKSRKIDIFAKTLTHAFGKKMTIQQIFYV